LTLIQQHLNITTPVETSVEEDNFFLVSLDDEADIIPASTKEYSNAWTKLVASTFSKYTEAGMNSIPLSSCKDVPTFFLKFMADGAQDSIQSYLESIGDSAIITSPWNTKGVVSTRTISYTHPVSNPLAPPRAQALKRQRLKRYGSHGMLLESETQVMGVPKTDCFVTREVILVQPAASNKGGVLVSSRIQIVFTKSTIFKSIINSQTTSELKAWHKGYGEMISLKAAKDGKAKTDTKL
jgi:hypothetical protein